MTGADPGLLVAFKTRWRTAPYGSQSRLISGVAALVLFAGIHPVFYLKVGSVLSLAAIPLLPVAGYVLVRGWSYHSIPWLAAGIVLSFIVTAGPLYFV